MDKEVFLRAITRVKSLADALEDEHYNPSDNGFTGLFEAYTGIENDIDNILTFCEQKGMRHRLFDEVNARIRFYFEQLLIGLKNRINMERTAVADTGDPKHLAKWAAYKDVFEMIRKEAVMMPPTNLMYEKAKRDQRHKIMMPLEYFIRGFLRGRYTEDQRQELIKKIVVAVEEAQSFNSQKFITEE